MAEESLKIVLTADNKQAIAAMKQTVTSLHEVDVAANKAGGKVVSMGKDFTGLSRVIQDLPYGFNAISNNLTNVLPAAGVAGLAISALTSAITIAGMGFDNFTKRFFGFRKATEDAKKQSDDFAGILAKEQTQLDLLYKTATNANLPLQARLKAVKDLRSNYGAYLQDFTDEELLANKGASAYDKLTEAILKNSRAKAASNMLTQLMEEKLKEEQGAIEDKIAAEEKMASATAWRGQAAAAQMSGTQFVKDDIQAVRLQKNATDELNDKLKVRGERIAEITKQMQFLNATIQQNTVSPFTLDKEEADKALDSAKKYAEFLLHMKGKMLEESMRLDAFSLTAPKENKPQQAQKPPELLSTMAVIEAKQRLATIEADRNKTLETANNLTNTAMNSITGMVNAMINGQNVGVALGDMFKRLAADIALAAAKALIFQTILSLLPGGTTGAALAKGEAGKGGFLGIFKKMLGFAEGGTVSGPRSGYPVMLHGTEHIVRPDQMRSIIASASQMGGGNSRVMVEGVIRGNDIWLSQSRTGTFRSLST